MFSSNVRQSLGVSSRQVRECLTPVSLPTFEVGSHFCQRFHDSQSCEEANAQRGSSVVQGSELQAMRGQSDNKASAADPICTDRPQKGK